ncbi:hypothetical protein J7L05_07470 [bacterium]|nr:hypothetical protein [bacterium]
MTARRFFTQIFRDEDGSTLVWTCVLTMVLLGFTSLVVDVGFINHQVAEMQKTADAAALAGAKQLPDESMAGAFALDLSEKNGYQDGVEGVQVNCVRNPDGCHSGWFQVQLSKPINYFFAPLLGYDDGVINVHATASYVSPLPLDINGGGNYGFNGIQNLSVFGPYAPYTYGDCFSTQWLNNGDDNPEYNDEGYNFKLMVPGNYAAINGTNEMWVEVFDPETWNIGNAANAGDGRVDEIRSAPGGGHPQPDSRYTTTTFQLFAPDDTPADLDDDVMIAEATYGPGDDPTLTDMQWVKGSDWEINLAAWGTGDYRINVKTIDGSSENGFNLRAGPPREEEDEFDSSNGTSITATGNLPMNFNTSGTVDINLGEIPPEAAGFDVYVDKFDTDVGAKTVSYYDDLGNSWPGQLSGNGTWKLDVLTMPDGYPGSTLYAQYQAGSQDTSVWQMYFDGFLPGAPAILRLVD